MVRKRVRVLGLILATNWPGIGSGLGQILGPAYLYCPNVRHNHINSIQSYLTGNTTKEYIKPVTS